MPFVNLLTSSMGSVAVSVLPKPLSQISAPPTTIPLPIPSRFPKNSQPFIASSPNGRVFLYSQAAHFVWEYDSKGRRVGEMAFDKESRVRQVICASKFVFVSFAGSSSIKVMEKESERSGKWRCSDEFEVSETFTKPLSQVYS